MQLACASPISAHILVISLRFLSDGLLILTPLYLRSYYVVGAGAYPCSTTATAVLGASTEDRGHSLHFSTFLLHFGLLSMA